MIASEEEYRIAKSEAAKFERSLASARESEPSPDVQARIHNAMIEGLESELDLLREQLDHYEALKAGRVKTPEIRSLRDHDNSDVSLDRLQEVADALELEIDQR